MMIPLLQKFKPFLLFFITIFVLNFGFITCESPWNLPKCFDEFNTSENYQSNVEALMEVFSSKSSQYTFYNDSFRGVYGLFLCRGDVDSSTCQRCINDATVDLPKNCSSSHRGGVIWYEKCLLRYSNTDFFGEMIFTPDSYVYMRNLESNTSPEEDSAVLNLLNEAIEQAAQNSSKLYGTQEGVVPSNVARKIYVLVQCTGDLNRSLCHSCLKEITDQIPNCCQGWAGWRFLTPSCLARFEEYAFYTPPPPPPPAPAAPQPAPAAPQLVPTVPGNGGKRTKVVIISLSSLAAALAFILAGFLCFSFCTKGLKGGGTNGEILLRNSQGPNQRRIVETGINEAEEEHSEEMHYFSLAEIQAATNNFSDANKLGEGGFGPVYKGIMHNGREVAVKRLSMTSNQGVQEFENEVKLIIKLQHKNLVRLLGYCLEKDEKLLVYEYMANTSLDAFLFDATKCKLLEWETRANVINGTAKGMQYLHEDSRLKIIHRDLKASNILLDNEMNPKISDFGTARIFGVRQMEANTERVVGTCGYMAPEYALEGQISVKSDVYSFGILMLEIISGKKNKGFSTSDCGQSLLAYAWMLWSEGKAVELIDPNIVNNCPKQDVLRWIQIALLCVQDDPAHRPTMSSVAIMLGSKSINLPQPSAAPYSAARILALSDYSSSSGGNMGSHISDQSTTNSTT
ncbi:hypothetical protein SLE2022_014620 [Rubroshorea leprosula]